MASAAVYYDGVVEEGKVVQELAKSGEAPPALYIQSDSERPGIFSNPPPSVSIPVIDLCLLIGHADVDEAAKLRSALKEWGMFQVVNHEMSPTFLDELRSAAHTFFHLPMEEKKKSSKIKDGKMGWEGYGTYQSMTEGQTLDWSDSLFLLVQPEDKRKLDLWPDEPSSFRDVLHEFTMKTWVLAEHAHRAIANLLELREDYITKEFEDMPDIYARFHYYPSCSRPDLVCGIRAHSDASTITILLPDKEVEGLQVLKDGEWFTVSTIPHALLINLGDQVEIMSNGIFKSPVHRVVTNSEKERITLAMFYNMGLEKEIEPAEGLVDEMRPRLYKKVKIQDYLGIYNHNFAHGKRTIDLAKLEVC